MKQFNFKAVLGNLIKSIVGFLEEEMGKKSVFIQNLLVNLAIFLVKVQP